jgi:hypothetical protein
MFAHWKIFWKVLPLTFGFCLLKLVIHRLGWEVWSFDALIASLFGSTTFVLAIVLGGTLADYRASEAMPGQIVNALETIQDSNIMLAAGHSDYDPQPLQMALAHLAHSILQWLQQSEEMATDMATVEEAIANLNPLFVPLATLGGSAIVGRAHGEQAKIRLLISQMAANRDTDFLAPTYVLLQIFLVGSVTALLLIHAEFFSENLMVSAFIFTSFVYLITLIRDLDNPFQYDGRSSVDVDLSCLETIFHTL